MGGPTSRPTLLCLNQSRKMCSSSDKFTDENDFGDDLRRHRWPGDELRTPTVRSRILAMYDRWTYSYMNRIFNKGARQKKDASVELTQEDLYRTPASMDARKLGDEFWNLYKETDGRFLLALWKMIAPVFVPAGVCQLVALLSQLAVPIMVMQLLRAVERSFAGSSILNESLPYVLAIFFLSVTNAFCTHRQQFLSYQSGIIIRTAITSAIYEKSLKLSPQGREGLTSGNVTNLVATDTQKLFEVMHDMHMIWSAPLAILIVVVLLLVIIGPTCLVGAFILVGLVPLSKKVAYQVVKIRRKRVAVADERIEIVTAMLQGIKVTKLNNYEDKFERRVSEARARELKLVRTEQAVWGLTLVIRVFTPVVASAATFATFVLIDESNILTASLTFTILMLFNMLKFPINQAGQLLSKVALGLQAMQRISGFMSRDEKEADAANKLICRDDDDDEKVLEVTNGTFFVGSVTNHKGKTTANTNDHGFEEEAKISRFAAFTLRGIDFSLARGEVLAVVGEVASGKSTLIQGLLGDLQSSDETVVASCSQNVAFAGQTPFILSDTVRSNIIFGSEYVEERYKRVIEACCLRPDLMQWQAGDQTEIGERGVTMSGGQKQRVSLARAVYAQPDVALFDDILSALDAGTSQRVFDNLFGNRSQVDGLLSNTGVVLVTHAVHVLQRVSKILVLDGGEAIFYGTWSDLQTFEPKDVAHKKKIDAMRSSLQLNSEEDATADKSAQLFALENNPNNMPSENESNSEDGAIMTKEEREHGISTIGTWMLWFKYAGGILFVTVQIILMACDRGSYVAIDWWLSQWTTAADQSIEVFGREFPSQTEGRFAQFQYLSVYAVLVVSMFVFLVSRSQWAVFGGIRACERVFSTMTRRVLHAPMSFFDTTPLGRIINRFTYDVEQVDITLSQFMSIFIIACSWLVAGQAVMITIVPYMVVINAFVLLLYVLILRFYRWSAADLQRLDAVSRSPIQASMSEALDGSTTIRAFHKNNHFLNIFQGFIDDNAGAMLNFVSSRRWLAVRLETLGAFVTLAACLFIATFQEQLGLTPGLSGLLIIWATSMTVTLGFLINAFSEAEAAITSIERMHAMELLPQEKSMGTSSEHEVDPSWPRKGVLEFRDVKMRYRPDLPLALTGLSFTLEHGQRCAIVGRTGAGKSTVTTALFRLAEIESGSITLDGVDLSQLGLSDVRARPGGMFILPQDPVLFKGTIKSNLDPFSTHNDEDILQALEHVSFPGVSVSRDSILEDVVDEGGGNFSAGEKQLLCLARAMLAHPRLLVLDEATSSVDGATDELVQRMLRSQFPDTTLLTIAHRLNTIIDYDVVLVMDKGKVAEFGPPKALLANEEGIFTAMVNATGPESAAALKEMAR